KKIDSVLQEIKLQTKNDAAEPVTKFVEPIAPEIENSDKEN
ncbi:MAG: hypothetical protein ACI8VI_001082, partial [Granulosicoccus sp.]